MKKTPGVIILLVTMVVLSGCAAQNTTSTAGEAWEAKQLAEENHDHNAHDHADHSEHHAHELLNIPEGELSPTVDFNAYKDAKGGYNIEIITSNFEFTPQTVNEENVWGTGHAHIYVDGYKVSRVYSNWYHLTAIEPGVREISISLNANDHSQYAVNDQPIEAKKDITVE